MIAKGGDGNLNLYLEGQGIDEHLAKVSRNSTQPFFTDHLGSILNSPIAGSLQSYDAFGRTAGSLPIFGVVLSSDPVQYGFAGRQFDIESGKYYSRARIYDPNTGRFMTQDPLGLRGGSNLYRYVNNNPLGYIDPLGLCTLQVGLSASYTMFAISGSINAGLAFDSNGNVAGYVNPTLGGAAGFSFSGGASLEVSNAASVTDLAQGFVTSSVSVGDGINGTFDQFAGYGTQSQFVYGSGITVGIGGGASAGVNYGYTSLSDSVNIFGQDNLPSYNLGSSLNDAPSAPTLGDFTFDTGGS